MDKMIGIVGGMGPYPGTDLLQKVFDNTLAQRDQDHLPATLMSVPGRIVDRTAFLLGQVAENPAYAIFDVIRKLESVGACTIGISCNTAHAPQIVDVVEKALLDVHSKVRLLHIAKEVANAITADHPQIHTVGLLCTTGTVKTGLYSDILGAQGINVVTPDAQRQADLVHDAICNLDYGIKAQSNPVTAIATGKLLDAIKFLQGQGAQAIILGCTELPLAINRDNAPGSILIDPTNVLARALIRATYPQRLK
ncbi:MAG: amino acid racemase [Psychrosphaera sp.]|nr:amino acid racemase [Psychrosphaera sp.]